MVRRTALGMVLVVLVALAPWASPADAAPGELEAHFIDVGQGDSCWLRLPNGDDLLVDGGKSQAGPTVVAYLREHGVTDVELMIATHGDADHIGGLLDVLDELAVEEAWLDSQSCATATCVDFYQSLASHGVLTATARMGDSHARGEVTLLVLNPSEPLYADRNENSIVLRISYGSVDLMLTGDAETGAEGRMSSSGLALGAEILKVAHHGSNSSSSAVFLGVVSPEQAVISVGPNPYEHPRPEVLQRLSDVGARIWRTDQSGSVVVTTDGETYTISASTTALWPTLYLPLVMRNG